MIQKILTRNIKLLLLTPTWDINEAVTSPSDLKLHASQIRELAQEYKVGLADSYTAFKKYVKADGDINDLLSLSNHPNRRGHELVRDEILRWFPF
jgi:hypothetical protein